MLDTWLFWTLIRKCFSCRLIYWTSVITGVSQKRNKLWLLLIMNKSLFMFHLIECIQHSCIFVEDANFEKWPNQIISFWNYSWDTLMTFLGKAAVKSSEQGCNSGSVPKYKSSMCIFFYQWMSNWALPICKPTWVRSNRFDSKSVLSMGTWYVRALIRF